MHRAVCSAAWAMRNGWPFPRKPTSSSVPWQKPREIRAGRLTPDSAPPTRGLPIRMHWSRWWRNGPPGWRSQRWLRPCSPAGVPAAPVLDSAEVMADPHLRQRGFVADLEHPVAGPRPVLSLPWAVDGQRGDTLRPAPNFGQHNDWVLKELLSVSDDEYHGLHSSGAIG